MLFSVESKIPTSSLSTEPLWKLIPIFVGQKPIICCTNNLIRGSFTIMHGMMSVKRRQTLISVFKAILIFFCLGTYNYYQSNRLLIFFSGFTIVIYLLGILGEHKKKLINHDPKLCWVISLSNPKKVWFIA